VAYDPAYGYEIGHIVADGLRRMYGEAQEDVFYYLTVYNEPYPQPAEPEGVDVEGILAGMHLVSPGEGEGPRTQILASGVAVNWALEAQRLLREDWSVETDVWSVTSWNELRREALEVERHNFLNPLEEPQVPYVTRRLDGRGDLVVGVSDWMTTVQDQIRTWVPAEYRTLGTDGWGMSDTRGALRRHFLVDAESIVVRTLTGLADRGEVDRQDLAKAIDRYRLMDPAAADAGNTEGSG
jgi:pyruvate dehydrogenase E1 component